MSYQYRNNVNNPPLPQPPLPPPPMLPMGMMGGPTGYDNMHQNYAMNHGMMMPGLNDAPLEFNMNKNMPMPMQPPLPESKPEDFNSQSRNPSYDPNDLTMQNNTDTNASDARGSNNRRRSRDRDGRRRDRKDEDKDNGRDRSDRRQENKTRQDGGHDDRNSQPKGKDGKDNVLTSNEQGNGINTQGMMFGSMGMGGMYPGNMMGMMGSMMMDPSMMAMGQYGMPDPSQMGNMPIPQANPLPIVSTEGVPPLPSAELSMGMMPMNNFNITPVKETVQLKTCSLVPPYPSSVLPTMREKPPGCRTVFVGSLPENITEEILTEIFERCGEITSLRLSKKNFCHIRFAYEQSVDSAVFFSGYRIRIDNKTDAPNCSRLHVDYAMARDDQHEWECKQRALQREARHRERMAARRRPPSPPPLHHYTDHVAAEICDKIKQDENFNNAVQVVITWLERGDCTKRNVNTFYSMIQSTNSHVRRLLNDKTQFEEELQRAKDEARVKMQNLLIQFGQVEKVFAASSHKKVWDHFSKAQRKNIEMWKKQSSEIRILQLEDFLQETGGGEEMDVSDEEGVPRKRTKADDDRLKEENDCLKCQLEAYKNEIDVLRSDNKSEVESKSQKVQQLQSRVSSLEDQLAQARRSQAADSIRMKMMLENKKKTDKLDKKEDNDKSDKKDDKTNAEKDDKIDTKLKESFLSEKEVKLIGIISTFLHVHPFGASIDYLWSYVQKMEPDFGQSQLEDLLRKYPSVFVQNVSGVGANIERKWIFNGYTQIYD